MALLQENVSINTLLGKGSLVQGDLSIQGYARLDGDIKGDFQTSGALIIGPLARIKGNIKAKKAVISGIVLGSIEAQEGVTLLKKAVVFGDIFTKHLQVEDTAIVQGQCKSIWK